jgi:hypothetical protein
MDDKAFPQETILEKCRQCRGCIDCSEVHCILYSQGNPDGCSMERCKYCTDFLQKQRLYMNNVG